MSKTTPIMPIFFTKKVPYAVLAVAAVLAMASLLSIAALGFMPIGVTAPSAGTDRTALPLASPVETNARIGGMVFALEIVDTPRAMERGLSGRDGLATGTAMLFVPGFEDYHGIWMKEMRFPIDIIWLDRDFQVVTIVENALPESYPRIFTPSKPALYMLELPAGSASLAGLREGDRVSFLH